MCFATTNLAASTRARVNILGDMKVFVFYIGKVRDVHANAIAAEFMKRSGHYADCEMREIVPDRFDLFAKYPTARKVFLDPAGRAMDSPQFIHMVEEAEQESRELVFVVGGYDGLPPAWSAHDETFPLPSST